MWFVFNDVVRMVFGGQNRGGLRETWKWLRVLGMAGLGRERHHDDGDVGIGFLGGLRKSADDV